MPITMVTFIQIKRNKKGEKTNVCPLPDICYSQERDGRAATKEPWLIFNSIAKFNPHKIMKLYSLRIQIKQNFHDEKNEHFGLCIPEISGKQP
jgi:hypothetical protein